MLEKTLAYLIRHFRQEIKYRIRKYERRNRHIIRSQNQVICQLQDTIRRIEDMLHDIQSKPPVTNTPITELPADVYKRIANNEQSINRIELQLRQMQNTLFGI